MDSINMESLNIGSPNRESVNIGNGTPKATHDGSAPPVRLDTLPGELLSKILTFAMASDVPVYFWLFMNFTRDVRSHTNKGGHMFPSQPTGAFLHDVSLPENQKEHYLDWRIVTSISHDLRSYGEPAFFHSKTFIIPPTMLRVLQDSKARSSNFDMAIERIQHIAVPVSNFVNGSDFITLPKYHFFTRLSTLTIRAPDSTGRILDAYAWDRQWPRETPMELLELLRRLGLRVDRIEVKLVVIEKEEDEVPLCIDNLERGVYPLLRTLVRRRAKPGDPPV